MSSPPRSRGPRRFIVRPGDPLTLAGVLELLGDAESLADGRAFVSGVRATAATWTLAPGDVVEVRAPREATAGIVVLARHAGFVFVDKPPTLPTEPDRQGLSSARSLLAAELGVDETELHAVSRLDVGVSGVVTFATSPAAKRLAASLRARGAIERRYVGIASRPPAPERGQWRFPIADKPGRPPRDALTDYAVAGVSGGAAVLALAPRTGRLHQLRRHAAAADAPLLGDRRHGRAARVTLPDGSVLALDRVALHAASVAISDPDLGAITVCPPLPSFLEELWRRLGGDVAVLRLAVEMPLV